jgi:hypothetical protein
MQAPETALSQGQKGSSDLPPSSGPFQANAEARYLLRGAMRVYRRLMCIFRHLMRKEQDDMCVSYALAAEVMPSGKASGDISERPTTPIRVDASFASSNGVAPTSTGIISGRSILLSTPT